MEVFWDIEYGLYYASIITFINTVEGNRIFENDYELARQLNGNRELSRNMTKEYFQNVQTAARIVYENGTLETKFNEAYNAYVAARAVYQNDATRENEKLMEKKLDAFYVFGPSGLPYLLNKMQSEPTEDKRLIDMFNRLLGHGSSYHRGAKYKNLSQCVAGWNFYSRYYQEMLDGTYKYRPYEEIMREEGHQ